MYFNRKTVKTAAVLAALFFGFFLLLCLSLDMQKDPSRHTPADETSSQEHLQLHEKTGILEIQSMRHRSSRPAILFYLVFSLMSLFALWKNMEQTLVIYLRSHRFLPVRYLQDLFIQKKKDGKKRRVCFWASGIYPNFQ